jgi:hypothetical protein
MWGCVTQQQRAMVHGHSAAEISAGDAILFAQFDVIHNFGKTLFQSQNICNY